MDIPDTINELAKNGLIRMRDHPQHHFDWRIRREMYRHFASHPMGNHIHGWLAILTAEYVLPLFTTVFPAEDLPIRLLDMAKRFVEGDMDDDSEEFHLLHDDGYHYYWEGVGEISVVAEYAGYAAYKALVEASGHYDMLGNVETLRRGHYASGEVIMSMGATEEGAQWDEGSTFTDEDIAHLAAYSDTASTAAMASAFSTTKRAINPKSLRAFWEWWIYEALPQAWQKV